MVPRPPTSGRMMPHDSAHALTPEALPDAAAALVRAFSDLLPDLIPLPAAALPADARALLDHEGGMTSALEGHWGRAMTLQVLGTRPADGRVSRAVTLSAAGAGVPAELGLITIRLEALPPALRPAVLAGTVPFGRVLADGGIGFSSRPCAFFRLRADTALADILRVAEGATLFGRATVLRDGAGRVLAEAMEILSGHAP